MPVLHKGDLHIDFTEDGEGDCVILIHGSISGNRQWHALIETLKDRYYVLAINLFGYGDTSPWPDALEQTLADQANLVLALCEATEGKIQIVGHSFGALVALKVAALLGNRITGLVLIEPNPFYLLAQHGRREAYEEVGAVRDHVKRCGAAGDWAKAGERFADYWAGEGTWRSMSDKRRRAFLASLSSNFHEWDPVMNETTPIEVWKALPASTLVVYAADTRLPIRELVRLFVEACPHWSFKELPTGGHTAPLTRPDLVNPIVAQFLDRECEISKT
jgi:pimeloyl-ACP methyl ester carboxylesterase